MSFMTKESDHRGHEDGGRGRFLEDVVVQEVRVRLNHRYMYGELLAAVVGAEVGRDEVGRDGRAIDTMKMKTLFSNLLIPSPHLPATCRRREKRKREKCL